MARKTVDKSLQKSIGVLDKTAKMILNNIDSGYKDREIISNRDLDIQRILNNEMDLMKGVSNGNIVDFVDNISRNSLRGENTKDIDIFTEDIGNLFGYFQEMNKNRYVELTDLKFITKFIPAIGEAVKTTLDSIVSADDFSSSITRNLKFNSSLSKSEKELVEAEIEKFEKSYKLLKRLKNTVYNNALISGSYYVYRIPYNELFSEYDRLVKSGKIQFNMLTNRNSAIMKNRSKNKQPSITDGFILKSAAESTIPDELIELSKGAFEIDAYKEALESTKDFKESEISTVVKCISEELGNITTIDSPVLFEALEGYTSAEVMKKNLSTYSKSFGDVGIVKDKASQFADGTGDINGPDKFATTGLYIKYISPNKMVPINVYNQVIGYLHVHDTTASKKSSALRKSVTETNMVASGANMFSATKLSDEKKNKAAQTIVDVITDGIITNFSDKFVNTHSDFKNLIADCLVSNGFVNNSFQIQFIPANYVTAFNINESEDGIGQSILTDSLFPAKLLLSLLVSKLLMYMNNGGNRTIAHVKKGPIDVSSGNHTQRVIRMLQESNITFSDLLSTNLSFAKFNRNKNIQIPLAKNGDRLIDFEVQEGQDVNMETEMEKYLEKLAVMGTGVPSVIMEYVDVADHAKSLVTANIKYAGRIATLQSDLEEPTTELYKELIMASTLEESIKTKCLNDFEFKLCRPKVLSNSNMAEYLSTMQSSVEVLSSLFIEQNSDDLDNEKVKRVFAKHIAANMLPFIDWAEYEEMLRRAKLEVVGARDDNSKAEDQSIDTSIDDDF